MKAGRLGRWCVENISDDRLFVLIKGFYRTGRLLNVRQPRTFQEKLQWIKLHDRKEIYHRMVDKEEMKAYVRERVGEGHTVPTLGCWNSFDDIEWESLPDSFVLKNTYDSGSYILCRDKSTFDRQEARRKLEKGGYRDYYKESREWPYKGLSHRIIAEPLLNDGNGEWLTDYKFYTFNGEPRLFYITSGRGSREGLKETFFDMEGNVMDLSQKGYKPADPLPPLPRHLKEMAAMARNLAQGTLHLRVDFYEVGDKVCCGELTFFDGGGFALFVPDKWNRELGDWIDLNNIER